MFVLVKQHLCLFSPYSMSTLTSESPEEELGLAPSTCCADYLSPVFLVPEGHKKPFNPRRSLNDYPEPATCSDLSRLFLVSERIIKIAELKGKDPQDPQDDDLKHESELFFSTFYNLDVMKLQRQ